MRCSIATRVLAIGAALCFEAVLCGESLVREGKAWLAARSDSAALNVNGTWHGRDWGIVRLVQSVGSREVSGAADGWQIMGVVSGKKLCLLFYHKNRIAYSAELNSDGPGAMGGHYARGLLTDRSTLRPIHFSR